MFSNCNKQWAGYLCLSRGASGTIPARQESLGQARTCTALLLLPHASGGEPETWARGSATRLLTDRSSHSFRDEHRIRSRKIQLPSSRPPERPLLGHVQHNLLLGEFRGKAPGSFRSQPRYVSPDLAVLVDPQGDHISSLAWTVEVISGLFRADGDPDFRAQPLDLDRERIDGCARWALTCCCGSVLHERRAEGPPVFDQSKTVTLSILDLEEPSC